MWCSLVVRDDTAPETRKGPSPPTVHEEPKSRTSQNRAYAACCHASYGDRLMESHPDGCGTARRADLGPGDGLTRGGLSTRVEAVAALASLARCARRPPATRSG